MSIYIYTQNSKGNSSMRTCCNYRFHTSPIPMSPPFSVALCSQIPGMQRATRTNTLRPSIYKFKYIMVKQLQDRQRERLHEVIAANSKVSRQPRPGRWDSSVPLPRKASRLIRPSLPLSAAIPRSEYAY